MGPICANFLALRAMFIRLANRFVSQVGPVPTGHLNIEETIGRWEPALLVLTDQPICPSAEQLRSNLAVSGDRVRAVLLIGDGGCL